VTAEPPDWAVQVPQTAAVTNRDSLAFAAPPWSNLDQQQLDAMRTKLQESIWQVLVQFFTGGLLPGPAGPQISNWATNLQTDISLGISTGDWNPLLMLLFGTTAPVTPSSMVNNQVVTGVLGPSAIGQSVQTYLDTLWQTVETWASGAPATDVNNSLANLGNSFNVVLAQIDNSLGIGNAATTAIINRGVTKPAFLSIDATADSVFPIAQISGSTPTFVSVTPTTAVIGNIGTPDAGLKTTILWLGQTTTNVTAIYITIYSVNTVTGALTRLFTSPNILAAVSNSLTWNYYNLPTINQANSLQGNWYALEMRVEGPGANYQIAGIPNHWLPANTGMGSFPTSLGASRTSLIPVAFDAQTTNIGSTSTSVTVTKSFTAAAGADVFVWAVAFVSGAANPITACSASYGGTSMGTAVGSQPMNASAFDGTLFLFRLAGAGTGVAQTASVTATATGTIALNIIPESYANVAGLGTITSSGSSSASPSQAATGISNEMTICAMAAVGTLSAVTFSAFSGTLRSTSASTGANVPAMITGDTGFVGAFNFTASLNASTFWGAMAVVLIPKTIVAPASIAAPGPPYSANVPWFGLGGAVGVTAFPPQYYSQFTASAGAYTYTVPTGMIQGDFFDIVVLGGGGGGGAGSGAFFGGGGGGGAWTVITLQYGVDIPLSTTTFTVTVGFGGAPGLNIFGIAQPGSVGNGCSVVITGYGTLTAAGGSAGPANSSGDLYPGLSPGNQTFGPVGPTHNTVYQGGAIQNISGVVGASPGGGGSGGGFSLPGGAGGSGAVWITAYQGP
jgi:hypothetical protein